MTQVVEPSSAEAYSAAFGLFSQPYSDYGGQSEYHIDYQPVSSVSESSSIDFQLKNSSSAYINLQKCRLHVAVKITQEDGSDIPSPTTNIDDKGVVTTVIPPLARVCIVNNALSSLFKCVDCSLNQSAVGGYVANNYSMKSFLDVILFCDDETRKYEMSDCLYFDERGELAGELDVYTTSNESLISRHSYVKGSKVCKMSGRLFTDLMSFDRMLLNNVDIAIKLVKNDARFCLISSMTSPHNFQFKITECYMRMCYVKPSAPLLLAQARMLEDYNAIYPYLGSVVKTFSVAKGERSVIIQDMFNTNIPATLVVCMTKSIGYAGSYNHNPYLLEGFSLSTINLRLDGSNHPFSPLKMKFDEGDPYSTDISSVFSCLHMSSSISPAISRRDMAGGKTIFLFEISETRKGILTQKKRGQISLELTFDKELEEAITIILYAKFQTDLRIENSRAVILN